MAVTDPDEAEEGVPAVSSQSSSNPMAGFGPNEWLVDEIYQQYLKDPNSVDRAWWDFFADYQPTDTGPLGGAAPARAGTAGGAPTTAAGVTTPTPAETHPAVTSGMRAGRAEPVKADGAARAVPKDAEVIPLKGAAARVVTNMEHSLHVPTATSVRAVPAKLLIDNRIVINNHLKRKRGGKVSFTHLIGYAIVQALKAMPEMNAGYAEVDGKPALVKPAHINLGLAIDLEKPDGNRQLLVPSIKAAEDMDFHQFWTAYEDIVRRARTGKLAADDFAGTTISLTNPGTIGTVHSVPRLMQGQGCIIGVGAMEYPAEYQGASPDTLARLARQQDHDADLDLRPPHHPGRPVRRVPAPDLTTCCSARTPSTTTSSRRCGSRTSRCAGSRTSRPATTTTSPRHARVLELIHSYRVRGHLMADTDPLEYQQRRHPDLDIVKHGLTLWDLEREFATGGFGGKPMMKLREILGVLRDSYCRTVGIEYMHIQDPEERNWIQDRVEVPHAKPDRRGAAAHPAPAERGRGVRDVPADQVRRAEAVLAGGRRVRHPAARRVLDRGRPGRSRRGLRRHGAPRPPQRARQHRRQVLRQIFREFEGNLDPKCMHGSGDVKYHLGAEGKFTADDGSRSSVSLVANPCHLEAVDPVLEGVVRAKQDIIDQGSARLHRAARSLLHGDAAFAGQGVVAETLNLSQLRGYRTGGTVHVVVNNQVGFTTAPAASSVQPVRHRRGPDDRGADLPRERRRPRGRASGWPGWPSSSARRSRRTSSSTWSATAAAATTRRTTRRSPSR